MGEQDNGHQNDIPQDDAPGDDDDARGTLRRRLMIGAGVAAAAGVPAWWFRRHLMTGGGRTGGDKPDAGAQAGLTDNETAAIEAIAMRFLKQFNVPGLAVAFSHKGRMAHEAGFGYANEQHFERVKPASRFRIASISKSITSVAIFTLVDQGRLSLSDNVFGAGGRLDVEPFREVAAEYESITVHHLLTHMSGGWGPANGDPMFEAPELGHTELIARTLSGYQLLTVPGTTFRYSNFNYCLLGRIIERVSGIPYADYVQQAVLVPSRAGGVRIAGNGIADRADDEVTYYANNDERPYGMNVARMDSHGGWIASAGDLVRFAMRVSATKAVPGILSGKAVEAMTQTVAGSGNYACGWAVNDVPNWWHNGSLPGTYGLLVHTASGLCWAALTNMRTDGIDGAVDAMMWEMARAVPAWKAG
jgi:CubicO group peptidase (beta-lactamase class C family)